MHPNALLDWWITIVVKRLSQSRAIVQEPASPVLIERVNGHCSSDWLARSTYSSSLLPMVPLQPSITVNVTLGLHLSRDNFCFSWRLRSTFWAPHMLSLGFLRSFAPYLARTREAARCYVLHVLLSYVDCLSDSFQLYADFCPSRR
ncbi:hypothetical protein HGRIS_000064 [Hohenbuehelia grisea]|uniref:Uncharacterized protein n=1 Tax=Hohenbuehelia grisea TaxID=104357 RepID=A0ABR3JRR8_9AGAR